MSVTVNREELGDVLVVVLNGRITLGEESITLREEIIAADDDGKKNIILDLENVTYVDSTGIMELVNGYQYVVDRGGQLKLLNLQKKAHDLLQITKFHTVIDIYSDRAAALASFA